MPGELVAKESSDTKGGYYTPIAGELGQGFQARPIFYGMLLANQLAGTQSKEVTLAANAVNATAYAGEKDGQLRIAIFNKDNAHNLRLSLRMPPDFHRAKLWRLTAPARFNIWGYPGRLRSFTKIALVAQAGGDSHCQKRWLSGRVAEGQRGACIARSLVDEFQREVDLKPATGFSRVAASFFHLDRPQEAQHHGAHSCQLKAARFGHAFKRAKVRGGAVKR